MSRAGKHFTYPKEPTRTTNLDGLWNLNEVNTHIKNDNWPDSNLNISRNQYNIGAAYINYISQGLKPRYDIGAAYLNITGHDPRLNLGCIYLNVIG